MKQLETQIRFTGEGWKDNPRLLVQVKRTGHIAIYAVYKAKEVDKHHGDIRSVTPEAWEVIRIREQAARMMFGYGVEAHEVYPSAKQFGPLGKSVMDLDRAEQIFEQWAKEDAK